MTRALILTYHAVEPGPAPLCTDPALFAEHADVIAESGARVLTITDLAAALRKGALAEDTVAITFDDGFASVAETAAPVLAARALRATLFCVAGHLGGTSDWPSALDGSYRSGLASASALTELAAAGFEIGSHGMEHEPLAGAPEAVVRREVVDSRSSLEEAVGTRVTSYAFPYGALPGRSGRKLVEETYEAACATTVRRLGRDADPHALARVDAYYLRNPDLLRRALRGDLGGYLRARNLASRARRTFVKDYRARSAVGADV